MIRPVPRDLGEASEAPIIVIDPAHDAINPKTGTVFAQMPPAIGGMPILQGYLHFFLHRPLGSVFRCENKLAALSDSFDRAPAKDPFGARAPVSNLVIRIEQEHRVIRGSFDQQS